ncbi:hypothetical protein GGQ81_002029 [Sphingomonas desiccabilis]|nr:hypothetical protein [Sphingomonas desiccabilis]
MTTAATSLLVIPAKAGIHRATSARGEMDPGLRRDDGVVVIDGAQRSRG